MTDAQTKPVTVIQADRDLAARWCGYGPKTNDQIRAGECDHLPGVQDIARHRQLSNEPILEALDGVRVLIIEGSDPKTRDPLLTNALALLDKTLALHRGQQ